jgi:APA family basic amino acid/polyamine antiporter
VFSRVHAQRRTPWVAIIVVTAVAVALVVTGTIGALADTTVVLLLSVFALVNICVLVLRRDHVEARHFRAPSFVPVLGAASSSALVIFTIVDEPKVALRAVLLIAAGTVLWIINRAFHGHIQTVDVERLDT